MSALLCRDQCNVMFCCELESKGARSHRGSSSGLSGLALRHGWSRALLQSLMHNWGRALSQSLCVDSGFGFSRSISL